MTLLSGIAAEAALDKMGGCVSNLHLKTSQPWYVHYKLWEPIFSFFSTQFLPALSYFIVSPKRLAEEKPSFAVYCSSVCFRGGGGVFGAVVVWN